MKTKIKKILLCGTALAVASGVASEAQTTDTTDLDQMKAKLQSMQTNMDAMQEKINELEEQKAQAGQVSTNMQQSSAPPVEENSAGPFVGPASPIQNRDNLNNEQIGA